MIRRRWFVIVLWWALFSLGAQGQDIHFSQFYTAPLLINPANAGFFNCDYRLTANYRNQWKSITVPFKTFTGSADLRLIKGHNSKNIIGLGLVSAVDKAGDSKFTTTQFSFAASYHKNLDHFGIQYLGGGIMLSYATASIDYSNLLFSDQYVRTGVTKQTAENIGLNSLSYFDISIGGAYNYVPDHQNSFSIGGAIYHINQPKKSFLNDNASKLPRKYILNSGLELRMTNRIQIYPKAMFALQGASMEFLLGSFARVNLDKMENSKYGIYLGTWYRIKDALIVVTRFDIDNFSFSFSYDLNMSQLREVSNVKGGPEFSLIYIGCIPTFSHKAVFCPRF